VAYRRDIDGLRAVAVLAVVLFHLGALPGGFTGVDVFFVISGYLIASQLYAEVAAGSLSSFSILAFYERRARRILPALLATIVASSAAAALLFYPRELVAFATSAIASALFCANFHFQATGDYFAPSADTIPLLHLWSVGIEEQFYIVFPLLLVAVTAKLGRRTMRAYLGAALAIPLLVSLAVSQASVAIDPAAAFYRPESRAFELLIGCVLALPRVPKPTARWANLASLGGASCLAGVFALLDRATPFPGVFALLPCLATAAIIWSGTATQPAVATRPVSRLLALRPLVLTGRISYSLYLVHWPVLVFGKRLFPDSPPTSFALGVALISLALAALSYQFVEQPFRRRGEGRLLVGGLGAAVASMAAVVVLGAWTVQQSGFAAPSDDPRARMLAYLHFDPRPLYRSRECFLDPDQDLAGIDVKPCLPDGTGTPAMLWGDSHAADLYPGLRVAFAGAGYSLGELTASACAPLVGRDAPARPKCRLFNDQVLALLLTLKPAMVILSAEWLPDPDTVALLNQTVTRLSDAGSKVIILGNSPLFKASVPNLVADRMQSGDMDRTTTQDIEGHFEHATEAAMSQGFSGRAELRYISIFKTVCPNSRCPLLANDETPIYFDSSHLTGAGSLLFAQMLTPQILR
jgi:peptidoglycan/LPS O-acetylase OafA/YrhL